MLGSANVDLAVPVDRRPGPGETVLAGDTTVSPGGKGANAAVAAARLGGEVVMLGAVGGDSHGELVTTSLREAGVDESMMTTAAAPTGVAYVTLTPDGENSIIVSPGANNAVTERYTREVMRVITESAVLVASLEIPPETVWHAITSASEAGTRCVLNASPVTPVPAEVLPVCDPLLVNEHEAASLLGSAGGSGDDLAAGLLRLGPRSAVVTSGPDGASVADSTGVHRIPAPAVSAVDSTGAGDAFCGALVSRLATPSVADDGLVDAARYAVRVAAVAVRRTGAQASYPHAQDVPTSWSRSCRGMV